MKRYVLSFAASTEHKPEHPNRTATRALDWDTEYQVWPSRGAMLKTVQLQERAGVRNAWRPVVPRLSKLSNEELAAIRRGEVQHPDFKY